MNNEKKTLIILVILIILIIFFTGCILKKKEKFNNQPISIDNMNFDSDNFLNFNNNLDLSHNELPILKFKSTRECPILYELYRSLNLKNDKSTNLKINNIHEIKFRSLIQKTFYNVDNNIDIDFKLLKIKLEDPSGNDDYPDFIFNEKEKGDLSEIKYKTTPYEYNVKKSLFNVNESFEMNDIMRFMDYNFTRLCLGAVNINNMAILDNHFFALKCPNHSSNNNGYFLLPVRIRQQCFREQKEYTRAKCTNCAANLLVFFDKLPNKFEKYINRKNYGYTDNISSSTEIIFPNIIKK